MILVDTSVWVSHFNHGEGPLEKLLDDARVMTHDFIIGELACGNLRARKEILALLQALPSVAPVSQAELLHFIEQKHLAGTGIGFVDAHLLACAQLGGVPIWTLDARFKRATAKLNLSYAPLH